MKVSVACWQPRVRQEYSWEPCHHKSERASTGRSPGTGTGRPVLVRLDLAFFLEDLLPILDQEIERFLRRPLVGYDVVMDALLHVEQQFCVGRLGPEVLDDIHRLQEVGGKGRALCERGITEHRLVAGHTA